MTTIIEQPGGGSGSDGGIAVIAVLVGAIAALVIGLFALGTFERKPVETNLTIETPAPVQPAPESAPAAPQQ